MSDRPSVPDLGQSPSLRELHVELIRFGRSLHLLRQSNSDLRSQPAGVPIMARLAKNGPMRSRQLAEAASLDPSTVSRQVDQLVKAGYVHRIADPDDGRATLLELTSDGHGSMARHAERISQLLEQVLHDWTSEQIDQLAACLHRLNDDSAARLPGLLERPPG